MTAEAVEAGTGAESRSGDSRPFRIALLSYKGNPFCGGQGVYVRHLSRALVRLGHHVEVLSGPPYPDLDDARAPDAPAQPRPLPPGAPPFRAPGAAA